MTTTSQRFNSENAKDNIALIKQVIIRSNIIRETKDVFTPIELCDEIVKKIPSLDGKILVVSNPEFVYALLVNGVNANDIYFASPCDRKNEWVGKNIPINNIIKYDNVITKEDVGDMKFDVVVGNPPYNKHGSEPIYYEFLRQLLNINPLYWSFIIPNGWLVGPRSKSIRKLVFSKGNITEIVFKGPSAFNNIISQNTVIVYGGTSQSKSFNFTRQQYDKKMTTKFSSIESINEMPMVFGKVGKDIWKIASLYDTHFNMKKKLNGKFGVAISDGNGFGAYDETIISAGQAAKKAIMPIYIVTETKTRYNHHSLNSLSECENAKKWFNSKLFGILFMMIRTTHRTTGANMGRMPVVVIDGEYTDDKAYKKLGLNTQQINWIHNL